MKVINIDKDGNVIEDLSKVVLPEGMQKQLIRIYYKEERREKEISS